MGSTCRRELSLISRFIEPPACVGVSLTRARNSVRSGTLTAPLVMPTSKTVCPKCGNANKSGKRSCCARGGTWFKRCGDVGDTNFNHTWTEGILSCQSKLTMRYIWWRTELRWCVINSCHAFSTAKQHDAAACRAGINEVDSRMPQVRQYQEIRQT